MLEGSPLSFNNWCDVDRALETISAVSQGFDEHDGIRRKIAVGVKHGNACGASVCSVEECGATAAKGMIEGDKDSIFGGTVITNFPIGKKTAETLVHHCTDDGPKRILDVVIAPAITDEARDILRRKNGGCRMLINTALGDKRLAQENTGQRRRQVRGGFLEQGEYSFVLDLEHPEIEVHNLLTRDSAEDLILAWAICGRSNSNTITIVKNQKLIGNGTGQQSRVGAAQLAIAKARSQGHSLEDASAVSDSFFPFPDGALELADAGIGCIYATRGSIRDDDVVQALEEKGVTFVTLPDSLARIFYGH